MLFASLKKQCPHFIQNLKGLQIPTSLIQLVQHLTAHELFLHKDHNFRALLWADSSNTV